MDRPILFSGPLVRALLDGRKTQTRRVFKLPTKGIYERKDMGGWAPTINGGGGSFTIAKDGTRVPAPETTGIWHQTTGRCLDAPYQIGDRLWVREAWQTESAYDDLSPAELGGEEQVRYDADGAHQTWGYPAISKIGRFRQGMHMPRWASRLTLTVTEVRVQRLQDIGEADAIAEGCYQQDHANPCQNPGIKGFYYTWQSINAKRGHGWDTNPWVVAVTFTVAKHNIDVAPA